DRPTASLFVDCRPRNCQRLESETGTQWLGLPAVYLPGHSGHECPIHVDLLRDVDYLGSRVRLPQGGPRRPGAPLGRGGGQSPGWSDCRGHPVAYLDRPSTFHWYYAVRVRCSSVAASLLLDQPCCDQPGCGHCRWHALHARLPNDHELSDHAALFLKWRHVPHYHSSSLDA